VASLKISVQLARFIRANIEKFDIVHIHGLYRFPTTYAARLARKRRVPYVIRPHGSLAPYLHYRSARSVYLKRLYERWFDLPNLNGASAVHYTSEGERQDASFLKLRAPSFVVPNGIDWARFAALPSRGAFRAAYGIGNAPLVLFLGRVHPSKGLDRLIPAFMEVRSVLKDARLVIAGPHNDSYGEQLRAWVRQQGLDQSVVFVGFLEGAEAVRAYVDADVYALPSYTESFGLTVIEAMACGVPVVISDRVNIHQEISGAGAGLVTSDKVEAIAAALKTLLNGRDRAIAMGAAGRRTVQLRYSWPPIVDALTREYEAILARRSISEASKASPLRK
jgi:glycosyltransferase involved in cell wall biosynthesis